MKPQQKAGDIPSLDGLRAVAILLVFVSHFSPEVGNVVPGGLGVTVFFALSGFLITTLLRQEYEQHGDIDFKSFYLRRAIRLFPLLYLVVGVAAVLCWAGLIEGEVTWAGLLSMLFYWGNYFIAAHHYQFIPAGTGVVWSLAIEEHFYLLWPAVFVLLARLRASRQSAAWVVGVMCVLPLLLRLVLAHGFGVDGFYIERATETRFDALMVGCWLALARNPWLDSVPAPRPRLEAAVVLICLGMLVLSLLYRDETFRKTWRYTVQSVALVPLFWLAVARHESWLFRPLHWSVVRYIGQVSYALYLVHLIIVFAVQYHWPDAPLWLRSLVVTLASFALCELLRRWVENPLAAWRKRLHRGRVMSPVSQPL